MRQTCGRGLARAMLTYLSATAFARTLSHLLPAKPTLKGRIGSELLFVEVGSSTCWQPLCWKEINRGQSTE
eukprot:scaffold3602_cov407-Prasinococcus_capsulatus_cf.AAC.2